MGNVLVKASGNLATHQKVIEFVRKKSYANPDGKIVFVPGAGSKATRQLEEAGYEVEYDEHFNPPRRITKTLKEKFIVAGVLGDECVDWRNAFGGLENVEVQSPFQWPGGVPANVNGDDDVRIWCTEFDEAYVFAEVDNLKKKEKIFEGYPVEVIGI